MSWLAHTQLLDSAFPIGTFSHSFGLETLVQNGDITDAKQLRDFCETMLWGAWAPCDGLAVKAVYVLEFEQLWDFDQTLHLSRAARETRNANRKIGKRLLEMARTLYPEIAWQPLADAVSTGQAVGTFPVVYGWTCFGLNVSLERAATGWLYAQLSGTVNCATRAMRLGQTDAQKIIAAIVPQIELAWREVEDRDPWDFESSVPQLDIAAMRHETLYSRLFMS